VHTHVPQAATVLVASRGDESLVKLYGRRAWHFPRLTNGTYLGHHPANSEAAIVHLETMRALGASHFVLPEPSRWWLDHYAELNHYLETRCRVLFRNDDICRIYSLLEGPRGATTVETDALGEVVAEFRARFDRDPMILDWDTGRDWAASWARSRSSRRRRLSKRSTTSITRSMSSRWRRATRHGWSRPRASRPPPS